MTSRTDDRYLSIHRLATDVLERPGDGSAAKALADYLSGDAEAQQVYAEYMQETAGLRWRALPSTAPSGPPSARSIAPRQPDSFLWRPPGSRIATTRPASANPRQSKRRRVLRGGALLAAVLVGIALWSPATHRADQATTRSPQDFENNPADAVLPLPAVAVATLSRATNVQWDAPHPAPAAFERLVEGQRLAFRSGQLEILFDSGVELLITGAADLKISSATRVACRRGTLSARVGQRGKGFTIETPTAQVVDLGTEFGLSVEEGGETEVAVFRGAVDLTSRGEFWDQSAATRPLPRNRLVRGEALRIDRQGQLARVMAITDDRFPVVGENRQFPRTSAPLIASVSDNIRTAESRKFYRIVHAGLFEDVEAFVDRGHQWNGLDAKGLPTELLGADYVMPFNDDKFLRDLQVSVELARPTHLFILFNDNMDVPDWLHEEFRDTGLDIGLDEDATRWHPDYATARHGGQSIDSRFSVWSKRIATPATIVLGGVEEPALKQRGYNMYGIAAQPLEVWSEQEASTWQR